MIDGTAHLNRLGKEIRRLWCAIPRNFPSADLDLYTIMPDHLHGIILIKDGQRRGEASLAGSSTPQPIFPAGKPGMPTGDASPLQKSSTSTHSPQGTAPGSLGAILQNFKSVSTRSINRLRRTPGAPFWQRNYYEHVIRHGEDLERIRRYIQENSFHWPDEPEE